MNSKVLLKKLLGYKCTHTMTEYIKTKRIALYTCNQSETWKVLGGEEWVGLQ